MLFKKKKNKSIQLDDESKLIYDILGESDYKTFNRILLGLNYSSPGEYLRINVEEIEDILDCPTKLKESTFEKRVKRFRSSASQRAFSLLTTSNLDVDFSRINDKLIYELINRKFKSSTSSIEELESKVVKFENFCFYVEKNGGNNWNYLSHMKMLLNERKLGRLVKLDEIVEEKEIDMVYQFDLNSSNKNFKKFAKLLAQENLIDSSKKFTSLFIFPEKRLEDKITWKGSITSLLFLIEFLSYKKIITKPKNYLMSLSINFRVSENRELINTNLSALLNNAGFKKFNDKDFEALFTKNSNVDIKVIHKVYCKVYSGL